VEAAGKQSLLLVTLVLGGGLSFCARPPLAAQDRPVVAPSAPPAEDPVGVLRDWENATRRTHDFAHAPTSDTALGTDPYVVRVVDADASGRPRHYVGILRGRSALVALDADLNEIDRISAPRSPSGLAVTPAGEILVVGELSREVARYRLRGERLERSGAIELPDVVAMRDVTAGPDGSIDVVEEHDGRLITMQPPAEGTSAPPVARRDTRLCHGPFRVLRTTGSVLVDCLLDHAVIVRPVDAHGVPLASGETRIVHDGPMWGMDAIEDGAGQLLVAVGGVEDHPLDRTEGSFAFIDSFVTLYRVAVAGGSATKLAEVNTSAQGVVVPKVVKLARPSAGGLVATVAGYASDHLLTLTWHDAPSGEPAAASRPVPPGIAMAEVLSDGTLVGADPLVDAWVRSGPNDGKVVPVDDGLARERSTASRLGEALFFTTLMAPWDKSDGRLSRFTCETCHWEGYVDGRTHHTGRGTVHATTKPLLGLMSNRPHFSRALDPDMATMVNAEFGVAGAKSDHSPWFAASTRDFPWLENLGLQDTTIPPEGLRRALMTFLMDFTHRPNPATVGRTRWTPLERHGAAVFRDRCESCHEARLVADEPSSRVPFDRWEELVFSPADAIVWAHSDYEKTGVEPYVNERGARVVSLRRLYKKHPYFTNGTAPEIGDVLDRVRFGAGTFFHEGAPDGAAPLTADEKTALAAFVDLL
jgi:hypothetical protein